MIHFAMGWDFSAHVLFINHYASAGIDLAMFHFTRDLHAIIADMDSTFIVATRREPLVAALGAAPNVNRF